MKDQLKKTFIDQLSRYIPIKDDRTKTEEALQALLADVN